MKDEKVIKAEIKEWEKCARYLAKRGRITMALNAIQWANALKWVLEEEES